MMMGQFSFSVFASLMGNFNGLNFFAFIIIFFVLFEFTAISSSISFCYQKDDFHQFIIFHPVILLTISTLFSQYYIFCLMCACPLTMSQKSNFSLKDWKKNWNIKNIPFLCENISPCVLHYFYPSKFFNIQITSPFQQLK